MFTGLIRHRGALIAVEEGESARHFRVRSDQDLGLAIGDSIALDGACMTATRIEGEEFDVTVAAESLDKTTLGAWEPGQVINLELPLALGERLDGHLVSGHVDGRATFVSREVAGEGVALRFKAPEHLSGLIATKGSVTLNGISLTVNWVEDADFGVLLVPHTLEVTNLGELKPGDLVNLEADMVARYVARLREVQA